MTIKNHLTRKQLEKEVIQLREDLNFLCKTVVQNRRIIASLMYVAAPSGWSYVPNAGGPARDRLISDTTLIGIGNPPTALRSVPFSVLANHVLIASQL